MKLTPALRRPSSVHKAPQAARVVLQRVAMLDAQPSERIDVTDIIDSTVTVWPRAGLDLAQRLH